MQISIAHELDTYFGVLANSVFAETAAAVTFVPDVRLADPAFGDFQVNGVLPFAKKTSQNPRILAQRLVEAAKVHPFFVEHKLQLEVAGPGFINIRLAPETMLAWFQLYNQRSAIEHSLQSQGLSVYTGTTAVVDYSSPNTAKQMHVGHLRSMVIGEAIQRILRAFGTHIVRDNHIGDWGTQFGILIMATKHFQVDVKAMGEDAIEQLESLYREGSQLTQESTEALEFARKELVLLQQGDTDNLALWKQINAVSYKAFQTIYDLFKVEFDVILGESFYRDQVDRVCKELRDIGLAKESEQALVVFHPEHPRFATQPFIIRKSDGATNYATTDLAAALYRREHFKADHMINVVDSRQQDHFEQLKLTVSKWFEAKHYPQATITHVAFGTILGEDGKAIKTRSGDPIKLKDLVQEGIERAYKIVSEKNPSLAEAQRRHIAQVVAIGAIRYADLSQNRTSDYVFSWDKFLSFEGNTAPYLLYAVARIHSIFRKAPMSRAQAYEHASAPKTEHEMMLARKLIAFPNILCLAVADLRPHILCTYIYELAGIFSTFYNAEKVIVDAPDVCARKLLLCAQTLEILTMGLDLLGLETLESM